MVKELSSIMELKSIREQKSRLSERENELAQPLLTDLDMIPRIYEWFNELLKELPNRNKSTLTKEFIFIILFLYSPGTLAGGKMKLGVRKSIADTLGLTACTAVSNKCSEIVFMYKIYKYFRQDLSIIYPKIMDKIQQGNI